MIATRRYRGGLGAAVVAVVALVLWACGGSDEAQEGTDGAEDAKSVDYAVSLMRPRFDALVSGFIPYDSLAEVLPNTVYQAVDDRSAPVSDSVVLGRFESAEAGRGFVSEEVALDNEVAFDDPAALWVTVHTRFTQDEVVAGPDLAQAGSLTLGFATDPQVDPVAFGESLRALGPAVVFIDGDSPVFDYDPGLLSVSEDGALVADVDQAGNLTLPFIDKERAAELLTDAGNVEDLRVAGQAAQKVVDVAQ